MFLEPLSRLCEVIYVYGLMAIFYGDMPHPDIGCLLLTYLWRVIVQSTSCDGAFLSDVLSLATDNLLRGYSPTKQLNSRSDRYLPHSKPCFT